MENKIKQVDYIDKDNRSKKKWAVNCDIIEEMENNPNEIKIICFNCQKKYCHNIHVEDEYKSISQCPYCGRKNLIRV